MSRLIVHLNLLLKHEENSTGRVAVPELIGEWMGKKILLRTHFVCFQGTDDYQLEMGGRANTGVNVGHIEGEEYVRELEEK